MTEKFALINDIKLCYKIYGDESNFPLICVHGFGSKQGTWMAQVDELSKHFKVITFDIRGCGKSDRPNVPYTMDMLADDIKGLMEHLYIEKAHFAGFSMGGMILQNFTLKYPDKVVKLVFINTNAGIRNKESVEHFVEAQIERLNKLKIEPENVFWRDTWFGFTSKFRRKMEAEPKKKFYGCFSAEDLINYIQENPPSPQDIRNQAHAVISHNAYDRLNQIKNETLVLAASHDRLVPKTVCQEIHKKMQNSVFKVIQKAGHESHKSNAPEVNKMIIDFLKN